MTTLAEIDAHASLMSVIYAPGRKCLKYCSHPFRKGLSRPHLWPVQVREVLHRRFSPSTLPLPSLLISLSQRDKAMEMAHVLKSYGVFGRLDNWWGVLTMLEQCFSLVIIAFISGQQSFSHTVLRTLLRPKKHTCLLYCARESWCQISMTEPPSHGQRKVISELE